MSTQRDKIQALLTLAQHPNTPQAEAETALALASKLMQKHGLSHDDVADAKKPADTAVVVRRFAVHGPYRVRRQNILYAIGLAHSCAGYRADDEDGACIVVFYGRDADITAAYTLFGAADMMGLRLLPKGDRSWRTSWWQGFQRGITEALAGAKKEFIAETPGSGLVLADRMKRAQSELRAKGPRLTGGYSYSDTSSGAYNSGHSAGRGFSSGSRSFTSGVRGEIG